jgi:hypothetical protein
MRVCRDQAVSQEEGGFTDLYLGCGFFAFGPDA